MTDSRGCRVTQCAVPCQIAGPDLKVAWLWVGGLCVAGLWVGGQSCPEAAAAERPHILWITSEDTGPHLGCYGDRYSVSPQLDALAARGLRYRLCWSNAPVCAPARTTLISGLYPTSTGSEHMRSMLPLPREFRMYPQSLREAGYYCTNNSKEDYNLEKPGMVWDESSNKAHWKNRLPGQPFFAIFNHTITHESQIRNAINEKDRIHDPAGVRIPAYHPDLREVRKDWAQYYDRITMMDRLAGANLRELEEAGLADDTIVFYFGDHGSGMPRGKRWPFDSGLHVPLIVVIPEKFAHLRPPDYQAGGASDRLVSFVDFAPTLLSLAGVEPPAHLQGHAFAGEFAAPPQPYVYGFRGRMDERFDMVRSMTDGRFVYIRNFYPHVIYGQHVDYMFQTPTTAAWKRLFDNGVLNDEQSHFWRTKPPEELYDLTSDPDEVHNLAGHPEHAERLRTLRGALREHLLAIRDVGFLPEGEIHSRSAGSTPYEIARDPERYPLERILLMAELASSPQESAVSALVEALADQDSAVRFWGAMGLLIRGAGAVEEAHDPLIDALEDESEYVQIVAAEALGRFGNAEDLSQALPVLLNRADIADDGVFVAMAALNALDALDERAASVKERIAQLPRTVDNTPERMGTYVDRIIEKTLADLN